MKTRLSLNIGLFLLTVSLAACATPNEPNEPGGPGIEIINEPPSIQVADDWIKGGYDALNALAKWQYDRRATLKTDTELNTSLKVAKNKLWKAITNSTRRRDAVARPDAKPGAAARLSAALEELSKVVNQTWDFVQGTP